MAGGKTGLRLRLLKKTGAVHVKARVKPKVMHQPTMRRMAKREKMLASTAARTPVDVYDEEIALAMYVSMLTKLNFIEDKSLLSQWGHGYGWYDGGEGW